jgi:predicted transcriptional regulator
MIQAKTPTPIRSAEGSVTRDGIYCLFDNVHRTMLARHLSIEYGITPREYRAICGLPEDYPMTVASNSEEKAALAGALGDGKTEPLRFRIVRSAEGSVEDKVIHCLFDGVATGFLQQYVLREYGMSWEEYLWQCGLPADYPRVAPYYFSGPR